MVYTTHVTDTSALLTCPCNLSESISVGGSSDTAKAELDFEIVFMGEDGNIVGNTAKSTLVCGSTLDWPLATPATLFRARPQIDNEPSYHSCGITAFVDVLALRPTTVKWNLSAHVKFPPGVNN